MSRYHLHIHLSKKKRKTALDKVVSVAAYIYPLSGLPQILLVFKGDVSGVSVTSWVCFMGFSLLFLAYGIMHKVRPMIVVNALWLVIQGLIVGGTLMHRVMK